MKHIILTILFIGLTSACSNPLDQIAGDDQKTNDSNEEESPNTVNDKNTTTVSNGQDVDSKFNSDKKSTYKIVLSNEQSSMALLDEEEGEEETEEGEEETEEGEEETEEGEEETEVGEEETEVGEEGDDEEDEEHIAACSKFFGKNPTDIVKVSGTNQEVEVAMSQVLAIKITGNQNIAKLTMAAVEEEEAAALTKAKEKGKSADAKPQNKGQADGEEDAEAESEETESEEEMPAGEEVLAEGMYGICVFIAGNETKFEASLSGLTIGKIGVIGKGNQPKVEVNVGEGAEVMDLMANLSGNQGSMTITGEGTYPCPSEGAQLKGNENSITCGE